MARIVRRETRKRGFFGWVFLLIFLAFNAFMLLWLIAYWSSISDMSAPSEAARAGKAIGATLGTGMLMFFWMAGGIVTGLLAFLARGRKTIIEETIE